jgi:protein gp37
MTLSDIVGEKNIAKGQYWSKALTLVNGCTEASEGCDHCWAARMMTRFDNGRGFAACGKWTGKVGLNLKATQALAVKAANNRRTKAQVFCVWNDLFHDAVSPAFLHQAFLRMSHCAEDIFLILTKRPVNISFLEDCWRFRTPSNIWLGVTVESQKHIGRIDELVEHWPGKKFVSIEPCLGSVDLSYYLLEPLKPTIDWVVVGSETGPSARPCHPDWVRSIRDQCVAAGVPMFLKSRGEFITLPEMPPNSMAMADAMNANTLGHGYVRVGKKKAGRELDGTTWEQFPELNDEQ